MRRASGPSVLWAPALVGAMASLWLFLYHPLGGHRSSPGPGGSAQLLLGWLYWQPVALRTTTLSSEIPEGLTR